MVLENASLGCEGRQVRLRVRHLEKEEAETAQKWKPTGPEVSHEIRGAETETKKEEEEQ